MIRKLNVSMNPWKLSDPVYESHRNTFLLSVVDNLKDLTHLNFSGIGLNEIPKVIENFIGLKVVDLSNNEISEIDGAIFNQVIFQISLVESIFMVFSSGMFQNWIFQRIKYQLYPRLVLTEFPEISRFFSQVNFTQFLTVEQK